MGMYVCDFAGVEDNAALKEKKNTGNRIMRVQTNIGYANSKKWDGICFEEKKNREIIVLCRINWRGGGYNSIKMLGCTTIKKWG